MFLLTSVFLSGLGISPSPGKSALQTNQDFVEDVTHESSLDIKDMASVFHFVLKSLPDKVKVYPTENYYYFSFHHDGMDYSGNIRLGVTDRDKGRVHFTYFPAFNGWRRDAIDTYKVFSSSDGVAVKAQKNLTYQVSFRGRSVVFELNDLSMRKPPKALMNTDEIYIGPVFDESGIQFFLLYNSRLKVFLYILDEIRPVADRLYVSEISKRIYLGRRTGFAFYQDKNLARKILVGVYGPNSNVNNYLDGPFDQLPDNFIKDDRLKNALEAVAPALKGKIDRYGFWANGASRYLIGPYLYYTDLEQLYMFDDCALAEEMRGQYYYKCFSVEEVGEVDVSLEHKQ